MKSSIYRYFENKHKFLLYLSSWYWAWIEYQLVIETHAIIDPKEKIIQAVKVITRPVENDSNFKSNKKRHFWNLAKKYHPDKNLDNKKIVKIYILEKIYNAYIILSK